MKKEELIAQKVYDLFRGLTEAKKAYRDRDDGGRCEAVVALNYVREFFLCFDVAREEHLSLPFDNLVNALFSLDDGVAVPLLNPKKREKGGRAPESNGRKQLRGNCTAILNNLVEKGMNENEVAKEIAACLNKAGVKKLGGGSTQFKARTIIKWKEKTNEEMRDDWAKMVADGLNLPSEIPNLMKLSEYKRRLLDGLAENISLLRINDEDRLKFQNSSLPPS